MATIIERRSVLALRALAWLGLALGCQKAQPAEDFAPLELGGEIRLTASTGLPFALSSLRGKAVLLFFGYTACPDVCPTTLSRLAQVHARLVEEGVADRLEIVFVSVDPERDTPARLAEYLGYFHLPTVGLTGTVAEVSEVARRYGASFERVEAKSAGGYLMNHSTYLYLIDPLGRVRHLFRHEDGPERIAEGVERVLAEDCCQPPADRKAQAP